MQSQVLHISLWYQYQYRHTSIHMGFCRGTVSGTPSLQNLIILDDESSSDSEPEDQAAKPTYSYIPPWRRESQSSHRSVLDLHNMYGLGMLDDFKHYTSCEWFSGKKFLTRVTIFCVFCFVWGKNAWFQHLWNNWEIETLLQSTATSMTVRMRLYRP